MDVEKICAYYVAREKFQKQTNKLARNPTCYVRTFLLNETTILWGNFNDRSLLLNHEMSTRDVHPGSSRWKRMENEGR